MSTERDVTRLARRVLPPGELCCICAMLRTTTTDADRHQRAKQYWPIRRASNTGERVSSRNTLQNLHAVYKIVQPSYFFAFGGNLLCQRAGKLTNHCKNVGTVSWSSATELLLLAVITEKCGAKTWSKF